MTSLKSMSREMGHAAAGFDSDEDDDVTEDGENRELANMVRGVARNRRNNHARPVYDPEDAAHVRSTRNAGRSL